MNKFIYGIIISVFLFCACSDKVAGTSEEPNQFAYEDAPNEEKPDVDVPDETFSSSVDELVLSSSEPPQSSSSSEKSSSSSSNILSSSSSKILPEDGEGPDLPDGPIIGEPAYKYLSVFRLLFGNRIHFDENVMAYGLISASNYQKIGLYQNIEFSEIEKLFPIAAKLISEKTNNNCPYHLLSVDGKLEHEEYPSYAGYFLTDINEDVLSISVVAPHSCAIDNEYKVIGMLFEYCGELLENPTIEYNFIDYCSDEECSNECSILKKIDYSEEWVK